MQPTLDEFLRQYFARLMSPDAAPLPPCPRCAGVHISKKGYTRRDVGRLPAYLVLTDVLTDDFDEIHSRRHEPLPCCPVCNGRNIRTSGHAGLPRFKCKACRTCFNRRTGTPFTRNRDAARQRRLIRYLSLPLPLGMVCCGTCGRLISMRREIDEVDGLLRAGAWQGTVKPYDGEHARPGTLPQRTRQMSIE